jgi:hypothetical protein
MLPDVGTEDSPASGEDDMGAGMESSKSGSSFDIDAALNLSTL